MVVLDEVESVGVKRQFRHLQEFCRVKSRKVLVTVAEAVKLAEKSFLKKTANPEHKQLSMLLL